MLIFLLGLCCGLLIRPLVDMAVERMGGEE